MFFLVVKHCNRNRAPWHFYSIYTIIRTLCRAAKETTENSENPKTIRQSLRSGWPKRPPKIQKSQNNSPIVALQAAKETTENSEILKQFASQHVSRETRGLKGPCPSNKKKSSLLYDYFEDSYAVCRATLRRRPKTSYSGGSQLSKTHIFMPQPPAGMV